jgi:hypothetical protein
MTTPREDRWRRAGDAAREGQPLSEGPVYGLQTTTAPVARGRAQIKTAPISRGRCVWIRTLWTPSRGLRDYFPFFFAGAFFFAAGFAAFLVAFFIDRFSLTSDFATCNRSQCDSYIKLFGLKVKKKVNEGPLACSTALRTSGMKKRSEDKMFARCLLQTI